MFVNDVRENEDKEKRIQIAIKCTLSWKSEDMARHWFLTRHSNQYLFVPNLIGDHPQNILVVLALTLCPSCGGCALARQGRRMVGIAKPIILTPFKYDCHFVCRLCKDLERPLCFCYSTAQPHSLCCLLLLRVRLWHFYSTSCPRLQPSSSSDGYMSHT